MDVKSFFGLPKIEVGSKWKHFSTIGNPFQSEILVYEVIEINSGWIKLRYGFPGKCHSERSTQILTQSSLRRSFIPVP